MEWFVTICNGLCANIWWNGPPLTTSTHPYVSAVSALRTWWLSQDFGAFPGIITWWANIQEYHSEHIINWMQLHSCLPFCFWIFESTDAVAHVLCQTQEQREPKSATHLPESGEDGVLTHCSQESVKWVFIKRSHKMMFQLATKFKNLTFNLLHVLYKTL